MKISAKQYAEVLFEMINQASRGDIKKIIENFVKLLIAHNRISQVDKIIYFFEAIWNKNNRITPVQVISSVELSGQIQNLLKNYFKNKNKTEIEFAMTLDKNIKGGIIIRYGDKSIDYSLQNRLRQLRSKLI